MDYNNTGGPLPMPDFNNFGDWLRGNVGRGNSGSQPPNVGGGILPMPDFNNFGGWMREQVRPRQFLGDFGQGAQPGFGANIPGNGFRTRSFGRDQFGRRTPFYPGSPFGNPGGMGGPFGNGGMERSVPGGIGPTINDDFFRNFGRWLLGIFLNRGGMGFGGGMPGPQPSLNGGLGGMPGQNPNWSGLQNSWDTAQRANQLNNPRTDFNNPNWPYGPEGPGPGAIPQSPRPNQPPPPLL